MEVIDKYPLVEFKGDVKLECSRNRNGALIHVDTVVMTEEMNRIKPYGVCLEATVGVRIKDEVLKRTIKTEPMWVSSVLDIDNEDNLQTNITTLRQILSDMDIQIPDSIIKIKYN